MIFNHIRHLHSMDVNIVFFKASADYQRPCNIYYVYLNVCDSVCVKDDLSVNSIYYNQRTVEQLLIGLVPIRRISAYFQKRYQKNCQQINEAYVKNKIYGILNISKHLR